MLIICKQMIGTLMIEDCYLDEHLNVARVEVLRNKTSYEKSRVAGTEP
jgi:hypothetical protein